MALANLAAQTRSDVRHAEDRRADQGQRRVTVMKDLVKIERSVGGVKMRIAVPVEAYVGVTLRALTEKGATTYEVKLVHRDADLSVSLESLGDETLAEQSCQDWADYLERPALEDGMGSQAVFDNLRPSQLRRRCMTAIDKRRPRRAARRKPGNHGNLAIVRSEAEIISYE